ncbi:DnaJ-like protein subfamily B member 14 [Bienertia sinuspersici]
MECNKDDAIKAREIAETKFNAKDIAGAKKFALKAQKLYPGLEGISQMLATLDVYAAAEHTVSGEVDFYGVLGVTPQSDNDTIRKQYRKLALMLHPDKNKSIGADGAFKLISEAWGLLSDRNKRASYDLSRKSKGFTQKAKPPTQGAHVPPGSNGFHNFAKATMSNAKVNKNTPRANSSSVPPTQGGHVPPGSNGSYNFAKATTSNAKVNKNTPRAKGSSIPTNARKPNQDTFWTVCHRCKMQYEYLRCYLNQNLLCPDCHKPFIAIETAPPVSNGSGSSKPRDGMKQWQNSQQKVSSKGNNNAGYNTGNVQWTPFSGAAGVSSVAQAANVVQQAYEKAMKRKNHLSGDTIGSFGDKKRRVGDDLNINNNQMGPGSAGFGTFSSVPPSKHNDSGSTFASRGNKYDSMRELSHSELHRILMHKAKQEILKKLTELKSATKIGNTVEKKTAADKSHDKVRRQENAVANEDLSAESRRVEDTQSKEMIDRLSFPVPDPEFFDFDKDRTEKAFGENQVWAVYDNDDGMPRFYAMVQSVISRDPFRIRISWLNSKTNTELGPLNWVASGFSKTCGDFRVGRYEIYSNLNCFSHKVRWVKGARGAIRIFPRKGDVWALYRNWSPDWNEHTADDVIHKYDMVEVLEDYDEELGVVVVPLLKVAGFKALFNRHLDSKQVRRIYKEEIFRFSYQVPSHLLSGQEASGAPKGCRELDPAALPPEFLQVIDDAKEESVPENQTIIDADDKKPSDKDMRTFAKTKEVPCQTEAS